MLKGVLLLVDEFISHLVRTGIMRWRELTACRSSAAISRRLRICSMWISAVWEYLPAQFTDYLIEHAGLALVPGGETFFGPGSEGAMRICFATSREILEEGLNRLETGLKMFLEEKIRKTESL